MIPQQTNFDYSLYALIDRHIGKHSPQINDLLLKLKLQLCLEKNEGRTFSRKGMRMIECELFRILIIVLSHAGFDTNGIKTIGGTRDTKKPLCGGLNANAVALKDIINGHRDFIWESLDDEERTFLLVNGEEWVNYVESKSYIGVLASLKWWNERKLILYPALEMIAINIANKLITNKII